MSEHSSRLTPDTFGSPLVGPILGGLAVAVVTTVVYLPALNGTFVWDDQWLLVRNEVVHASDGLWRMWFTTDAAYYWPITNSVFWIEWRLFGTHTLGYHLVNLALHITAALLIWRILFKLSIPGGFLAALLWAVHPVNVEGVAWISQLKTVLSAVFCLLSILCYLNADATLRTADRRTPGPGGRSWYGLSLLAFLAGMLSKASIAPLPLMLLLIVWWSRSRDPEVLEGRHGAIGRWDLVRMVPFVLIAAALVPVNMWFETHGSGEVFRKATFFERLAGAGTVPWFYLGQALVPLNLMFIHPLWSIDAGSILWWLPLTAAIAATAILVWQRESWWGRPLLFAWAFFWIGLIPVLGFTDVSLMKYTLVSDHYQYLPLIAVTALAGAALTVWFRRAAGVIRWLPPAIATCAVAALAMLTWQESGTYRDIRTLLGTTIERNPDCWIAHLGLGMSLSDAQQIPEALAAFETALRLNPNSAEAHDHRGRVLSDLGRIEEAIPHFERAVEINPKLAAPHNNHGVAMVRLKRHQEAIVHFERALISNPNLSSVRRNLAGALVHARQFERAVEEWQIVIRSEPPLADSYNDYAVALLGLGRLPEAAEQSKKALQLQPDLAVAYMNLGLALLRQGQAQDALQPLERALQLDPRSARCWTYLLVANTHLERKDEAIAAAQKALALARENREAQLALELEAWLSANAGNTVPSAASLPSETPPGTALPPGPALPPEP